MNNQPERVTTGRSVHRWSSLLHLLGPLAVAALAFAWARSSSRLLGWELAHDHARCLHFESLPLQVRSEDAETVMRWFEGQGTRMPALPARVAGLDIVGARYSWLPDLRHAAHVFYSGERETASLYVMDTFLGAPPAGVSTRGLFVWIGYAGGTRVAAVAAHAEVVDAFARAFESSVASSRRPRD